MNNNKTIAIIGSGFSGLSSAAYLAKQGYNVHIYEKNETFGGRARQFVKDGFTFDMGPSWYWMPDAIESFFKDFGHSTSDFFELIKLSPAFDMVFGGNELISIPNNYSELRNLFELIEVGSSKELDEFIDDGKFKYEISISNLIEKPGLSIFEYFQYDTVKSALKLNLFSSYQKQVYKRFKNQKLRALMEFPVLFLGAKPKDTPALYSLMNYAGLKLGTYYPMGGFNSLVTAMVKICETNGVTLHTNSNVTKIECLHNKVTSILVNDEVKLVDGVIGSADYHHIETKLLDKPFRNYSEEYWRTKTFAPSSLIFYLGINKKIKNINHHTLFFDGDFEQHATEIYDEKSWPIDPLFYVCAPSKTDPNVAPKEMENLFILMPLATGIEDTLELRERYFNLMMNRIEKQFGQNILDHVIVKESYCINDFKNDYNSYGGNAYGLANTLNQTAIFKPKIINKKVNNLIYSGQLTVPGPGVPPSLISGKISANLLHQHLKKQTHEILV